jgi:hypothetical protein
MEGNEEEDDFGGRTRNVAWNCDVSIYGAQKYSIAHVFDN